VTFDDLDTISRMKSAHLSIFSAHYEENTKNIRVVRKDVSNGNPGKELQALKRADAVIEGVDEEPRFSSIKEKTLNERYNFMLNLDNQVHFSHFMCSLLRSVVKDSDHHFHDGMICLT